VSNPNWLTPDDWKWVQDHVPVACVDVLPVRVGDDGSTIIKVGLIHRDTPHQGRRWCMVGGRLWRDESFPEAATRQLRETLGERIRFDVPADVEPLYVSQYFVEQRPDSFHDPRQHAVTMNLIVPVTGEITPGGEAFGFNWFDPKSLPSLDKWGFGQDRIARICLHRWEQR
jgi:ADP-ribose pyrophosphatase YjhB (NUDIX family)